MLNRILKKRVRVLTLVVVLSAFLTAMSVFAATQLIIAKKGGKIDIDEGVKLVIPPRALEEDTVITANMIERRDRIFFKFGPDGTTFSIPAKLRVSWDVVDDVDDLTLYGEDGKEITPRTTGWGLEYNIDHFSLYYFNRR